MLENKRPFAIKLFNALPLKFTLHAQDLMKQAQRKAGLSYFGEGNLEEALTHLCASIHREANMHSFGLFITKQRILNVLKNRLRLEALIAKHPEILEIEITKPIIITGLQRTGTTRLHRLLAAHPQVRSLSSWEALHPIPLENDSQNVARKKFARTAEKALRFMSPNFFAIHPVEFEAPEEDVLLNDMTFISAVSEATMHVPSYVAWLENQDKLFPYQYLKKVLQVLQWQNPKKRWVLKTPEHLGHLAQIYKVFPDAQLIHTYRNPVNVIASFSSMLYYSHQIFSDHVNAAKVAQYWMKKNEAMLSSAVQFWEQHPEFPTLHISYQAMMENQAQEMEKICDFSDLTWDENAQKAVFETDKKNTQHKYGKHAYSLSDFNITKEQVLTDFDFYLKKFNIQDDEGKI